MGFAEWQPTEQNSPDSCFSQAFPFRQAAGTDKAVIAPSISESIVGRGAQKAASVLPGGHTSLMQSTSLRATAART